MKKKQLLGAACLLVVTAATVCLSGALAGADKPNPGPAASAQRAEEVRRTLREYFSGQYSEAACSAIYADLTHDGLEELVVVEMGNDRRGKPILLHNGVVEPDCFMGGDGTVLRVEEDGTVRPIYRFSSAASHAGWGETYLKKQDGAAYLLTYQPYTGMGRSDFEIALFSLGDEGEPVDALRERVCFSAVGEALEGDADPETVEKFLALSEELLLDAKPLLVYDMIYNAQTRADGPLWFSYLDELFTAF
ncbi:hypothetical protein [Oscillibacter sp.]|uniref:hypothetical protein n=1 Tax=Oscillibacter sp. TaxID=1945593 RepID=UPI002610E681|nr:hypothetical protein [Oscillibacter sp.]MDD3346242.1 hypothetical protein [Oscillibacter sp.]